ncbi:MAG: DNA adenine methylase [Treponema sp.]|jgi:adenine-specific DNA-methyltransferase|nr:DNA adenine methylase [Treponema sp.]
MIADASFTQAVKYTGSKRALLPHILALTQTVQPRTVFDGFSGSTRVSQAYAKTGYTVYANDIAVYSEVFNTAFLLNRRDPESYRPLIDHLNALEPVDGWFTEHYGGDENFPGPETSGPKKPGLKKPWQKKNTRKLDAIREEIDRLNLDKIERAVLITSLILALDKVDSTLGHHVSYLNGWSPRSYGDLKLELPRLWINRQNNVVMRDDVFAAARQLPDHAGLAYLDPPYGSNNDKMPPSRVRYASYYHLWTTICLNDRPELFGKAQRRADTSDAKSASVFEDFRRGPSGRFVVIEALDKLIGEIRAEHIILSYSSGGRATAGELYEVLNAHGTIITVEEINHKKNVMAQMKWTQNWIRDREEKNVEFLFLMKKR